jgi:low temperature requirement protein LtrA
MSEQAQATGDTEFRQVKRASWVELYFDLVFVLAVAQVAHVIADHPSWGTVWVAMGLFALLWWTWVGFTTLYNRYGDMTDIRQRIIIVAATIPCGLAAVAIDEAAQGPLAAFALSLAAVRLLLSLANFLVGTSYANRIGWRYLITAAGFGLAAFAPYPWWLVLFVVLPIAESAVLFTDGPSDPPTRGSRERGQRRGRRERAQARPERPDRHDLPGAMKAMAPKDKAYAVDAHHLSERFGLFIIILLGEVVASAGQGLLAAEGHTSLTGWATLAGAIAIAGGLWWIYFDSAADLNRRFLELSSGSPKVARAIFATGHMIPGFALIAVAAGLHLLLAGHAPMAAYWLVAAGIGTYLLGTRVALIRGGKAPLIGFALLIATFQFGHLGWLPDSAFLWLVAAWVAGCAYLASRDSSRPTPDHPAMGHS